MLKDYFKSNNIIFRVNREFLILLYLIFIIEEEAEELLFYLLMKGMWVGERKVGGGLVMDWLGNSMISFSFFIWYRDYAVFLIIKVSIFVFYFVEIRFRIWDF